MFPRWYRGRGTTGANCLREIQAFAHAVVMTSIFGLSTVATSFQEVSMKRVFAMFMLAVLLSAHAGYNQTVWAATDESSSAVVPSASCSYLLTLTLPDQGAPLGILK